ncbi:hypothetical protein VP01_121g4 [Puccinia sorghi]|uniref:Uncharacterized protein n=1 Tax=Puccinia sorghi TaxID=27349 RepID=A0A0L6VQ74_9BASI|nr:hypothetical protein VP01_121g4 [Puccinia sorghi]
MWIMRAKKYRNLQNDGAWETHLPLTNNPKQSQQARRINQWDNAAADQPATWKYTCPARSAMNIWGNSNNMGCERNSWQIKNNSRIEIGCRTDKTNGGKRDWGAPVTFGPASTCSELPTTLHHKPYFPSPRKLNLDGLILICSEFRISPYKISKLDQWEVFPYQFPSQIGKQKSINLGSILLMEAQCELHTMDRLIMRTGDKSEMNELWSMLLCVFGCLRKLHRDFLNWQKFGPFFFFLTCLGEILVCEKIPLTCWMYIKFSRLSHQCLKSMIGQISWMKAPRRVCQIYLRKISDSLKVKGGTCLISWPRFRSHSYLFSLPTGISKREVQQVSGGFIYPRIIPMSNRARALVWPTQDINMCLLFFSLSLVDPTPSQKLHPLELLSHLSCAVSGALLVVSVSLSLSQKKRGGTEPRRRQSQTTKSMPFEKMITAKNKQRWRRSSSLRTHISKSCQKKKKQGGMGLTPLTCGLSASQFDCLLTLSFLAFMLIDTHMRVCSKGPKYMNEGKYKERKKTRRFYIT